jgi:hypothetical protein
VTVADLNRLIASFDWAEWESDLRDAFADDFEAIALEEGEAAAAALETEFAEQDPYLTRFFARYVGERIKQLNATTRDVVTAELHDVLDAQEGDGATALAERLSAAVADSSALTPARALMIARTETAIAYNVGTIAGYHQAGVTHVEVSDGDDDDECAAADGAIWTLEEALAEPIAHPNCVRSFAPADDEEAA